MGLIGIWIPVIPDIILIWIAVLTYQLGPFTVDLTRAFWIVLIFFSIITLTSDYIANAFAVKKSGGNYITVISAILGLVIGVTVLGPIGILIGPFFAVFATEMIKNKNKDNKKSLKIAFSTVFAFIGSGVLKFILILILIIWFLILTL